MLCIVEKILYSCVHLYSTSSVHVVHNMCILLQYYYYYIFINCNCTIAIHLHKHTMHDRKGIQLSESLRYVLCASILFSLKVTKMVLQLQSVKYTHTARLQDHIDGWLQTHTKTRAYTLQGHDIE